MVVVDSLPNIFIALIDSMLNYNLPLRIHKHNLNAQALRILGRHVWIRPTYSVLVVFSR